MKKTLLIIYIFISLLFINNFKAKESVTFSKCIDGDTARVIYNDDEIKIRFLAVDAPELAHEKTMEEPLAKESSDYTCNALKSANKIEIEFDEKSDRQDKYERYLVWVFVDDELLQKSLVKNGLAKIRYTYDDYKYLNELYEVEKFAKENKVGIWNEKIITNNNKNDYSFIPYIMPVIIFLLILLISKMIKR